MNMRRWLGLVLLLVGLGLTACNGSGSSGFDGSPRVPADGGPVLPTDEEALITQVLTTQMCLERDPLMLCPTDVMEPTDSKLSIITTLPLNGVVTCRPNASGTFCSFPLTFFPDGFPVDAVFRLATRSLDSASPWLLGPEPVATGTPDAPQFAATGVLTLPLGDLGASHEAVQPPQEGSTQVTESATIRLAVLVWSTPPATQWRTLESLAQSEADWIFIGEWVVDVEF
jgi:hypothetical protein